MGEWSKTIGEVGESIAKELLTMVGWGTAQHGVQIPCSRPDRHQSSDGARRTHGIDYLASYKSPLIDSVGINLLISVKFSSEPYPNNPNRRFKEHLTDLAQGIECFKSSQERSAALQRIKGVTKTLDIGVLLWINNDKGQNDVIARVEGAMLSDSLSFEAIYLVDNKRAQFLYDSIKYARDRASGRDVTFSYHDTGKNVFQPTKLTHGNVLPVEYVNSSLLVFRISGSSSRERTLLLCTLEPFSEPGLKRLLGLAQSLSQGWCSTAIIAFPDYSTLSHSNLVQAAKNSFSDKSFVEASEVSSFSPDFRAAH